MSDITQIIWIAVMILLMANSVRIMLKADKRFWGITNVTVLFIVFHWVVALILGVMLF